MIATKPTTNGHGPTTSQARVEPIPVVNRNREIAVLVGALFLISTATFILSNVLITPLLGSHNVLAAIAGNSQRMIAATLIGLIEGVATVGIALALYPILRREHPSLALGYAGMRIAELAVAAVGFGFGGLLLVTLSGAAANGANSELGTVLVALRHWTIMLVYVYTAVGGVMLSYMLFRTRLVPRGFSVLGLIGYPALLLAAVLDMLGVVDTVGGVGLVGLVPGGLFELLLPIWLIAKGFNSAAIARMAAGSRQRLSPECKARVEPDRHGPSWHDNAASARDDMEVGDGRAWLLAQHDQRRPFSRTDRQGRRVVDEILVAAESSLRVVGQALHGLMLLTHRSSHGQVAVGEGNPDGHADPDGSPEQTQQ